MCIRDRGGQLNRFHWGTGFWRLATDYWLSSRLLLRHAVQRAQSPDEVPAINPDNLTIGKYCGEGIECDPIVGIAEYGHKHQLVGDVEIGIAGGQAPSTKVYRSRHWQLHHAQRMARLVGALLQPSEVVAQGLVVGIAGVRLIGRHHSRRGDEASDIVHMPMGVVALSLIHISEPTRQY